MVHKTLKLYHIHFKSEQQIDNHQHQQSHIYTIQCMHTMLIFTFIHLLHLYTTDSAGELVGFPIHQRTSTGRQQILDIQ